MWFNSKQRAEPYQPLTCPVWGPEMDPFSSAGWNTGAAWLSSARVVDVGLSPATSATLAPSCHHSVGHSGGLPVISREEGGDDVKSLALTGWATHVLQWR